MDASQDVLAEAVRAKRIAIDNDLEVIRVRLRRVDPRRLDAWRWGRWAASALSIAVGSAIVWRWSRRRRPASSPRRLLLQGLADQPHGERNIEEIDRPRASAS